MSVETDFAAGPPGPLSLRETSLWMAAGAVVLAAHLLVAYAYYATAPEAPSAQAEEKALKIELAPVSMAQPASVAAEALPPVDAAETLDPVEQSQPLAPETVQPLEPQEPVEPLAALQPEQPQAVTPPEAQPVAPEAVKPVEPQPQETTEPVAPSELAALPPSPVDEALPPETLAPSEDDSVVLPEDAPTPTPRPEPPKRTVEAKPRENKAAPKREKPTQQRRAAEPQQQPASQGGRSTAPRISPARWQSKVVAWLNRHKRYPNAARSRGEEGTADVAFTIDSSGRVLSVRIAHSSGSQLLDQAALDMVRRSSPVPAPPAQIARSSITLGVPVNFQLR